MHLGKYAVLRVLHLFRSFLALLVLCWRTFRSTPPLPLRTTRRRIPKHLAILLVPDFESGATRECMLESISRASGWCRTVGVETLTLYDTQGLLVDCANQISQRLYATCEQAGQEDSDVEYPLTPPSSDYSDSRPLSPENSLGDSSTITIHLPRTIRKRTSRYGLKTRRYEPQEIAQHPLTLCIASRHSGKPAIAAAASVLARRRLEDASQPPVSVETLSVSAGSACTGPNSVSAPDFLILHQLRDADHSLGPLELHGFPPWQIRLTEIYASKACLAGHPKNGPRALTEIDFRACTGRLCGGRDAFW
ncbi:hypothetical protein C8F01DRAFT_1108978 [Mycena amicta]|nr:hypothetical protein C8F01DRAFT_1108978 [Mycena amicta]